MDTVWVTDAVRFGHVFSVCVGLGTSIMADIYVMTCLTSAVDKEFLATVRRYHTIIWIALLGMWITGIGMVYIRTGFDPGIFSAKLCAKLLTVSVLTTNALLIGSLAMPLVSGSLGKSLLDLPRRSKIRLGVIGGISSASWMLALAMGVSKVLATSGAIVFVVLLPLAYLGAIACSTLVLLARRNGMSTDYRQILQQRPALARSKDAGAMTRFSAIACKTRSTPAFPNRGRQETARIYRSYLSAK